ncbi:MAG TPA: hypothetical protein VF773_22830 [Verrucomicrobiae bacterium]
MHKEREVIKPETSRRRKYLRVLGVFLLLLVILPGFIAPALYIADMNVNRGYTFGYWGEYNRASNALAKMPVIMITNSYYLHDATLELFSFDLMVTGKSVQLRFPSSDPIRELTGDELREALQKTIEAQLLKTGER